MKRNTENASALLKRIYLLATMAVLIAALTTATYAWFTSNQRVSTNTAEGRTEDLNVQLLISSDGKNYSEKDNVSITKINKTDNLQLMPVSTADLSTFVYNAITVDGIAENFALVKDEANYYHGRIYLKAQFSGERTNGRLRLYLDTGENAGGDIFKLNGGNGALLNAVRLGLKFAGGANGTHIFKYDNAQVRSTQARNTRINGQILKDGMVLTWKNNKAAAVTDPSVPISDYAIQKTDTGASLPKNYLCEIEPGKAIPVDVYFYLEGCDPDCSDSISLKSCDIHLAFFGVLVED